MTLEEKIINSLILKYDAQKQEASAMIELLIKKSVGLADHSNIVDELDKWVQASAEAEERKRTLMSLINVEIEK